MILLGNGDPVDLHPAAVVLLEETVAVESELGTDPFTGATYE